jgi:DNA-directed RNA polymerase specialized sigma24 family protein
MFVNELATRDSLARMIRRLTGNDTLRDDLLQEALIHLWTMELSRSGQTRSWYLQSCKYHLQHYLAGGRSIDSAKRRDGQLPQALNDDEMGWFANDADSGNPVFEVVSARDIIAALSVLLDAQERAVLECFADGLRVREIGRKLKVSHTMVIRHRRKIALLFKRLDRSPCARTMADEGLPGSRSVVDAQPCTGLCGDRLRL